METTIVITKWIYRTEKIYEHNVCFYFWSTIILHRLSQDLIGNSKYDYSLRKPPPPCVSASSFVHCTCFMKEGTDWTSGHGLLRTVEWFTRRHGEWVKFYYANSFDLCKYLYWYRYIKKNIWKNYILKTEMSSAACVSKISHSNVSPHVNKMTWNHPYTNKMCWLISSVLAHLDSITRSM